MIPVFVADGSEVSVADRKVTATGAQDLMRRPAQRSRPLLMSTVGAEAAVL